MWCLNTHTDDFCLSCHISCISHSLSAPILAWSWGHSQPSLWHLALPHPSTVSILLPVVSRWTDDHTWSAWGFSESDSWMSLISIEADVDLARDLVYRWISCQSEADNQGRSPSFLGILFSAKCEVRLACLSWSSNQRDRRSQRHNHHSSWLSPSYWNLQQNQPLFSENT